MPRRLMRRWVQRVFIVAALVFLALALRDEWPHAHRALTRLGVGSAALALLPVLVALLANALSWRVVLIDLAGPLPLTALLRVFFVAQLSKYVPGSVWPVVVQTQLGRDYGLSGARVATSGVVAMGISASTGLLIGAALFPLATTDVFHHYWWVLLFIPVCLAALHPPALTRLVNVGLRLLRRPPLDARIGYRTVLRAVGWSVVSWAGYGVQIWILAHRLGAHGARLPALAIGGFALAWTVGFLVILAPAGLGPREVILVLVLRPVLAAGPATAVALVSRVVMTVADLGWGLVWLPRYRARRTPPEPDQPAEPVSLR